MFRSIGIIVIVLVLATGCNVPPPVSIKPGTLQGVVTGPSGPVYSVAFAPGGRTLAAADSAGRVWLWDTGASVAARAVCAMAGQPLTHAEWHAYVPGLPYAPPCR